MGVYINMEMPKDGAFVEVLIWSDGHVTQTGDSYFAENGRAYYQPCDWKYFSAVPIPPHGRLIDADALIKTAKQQKGHRIGEETYTMVEHFARHAPTIIPAEEEG